jgi:hypothetical protein
MPYLNLLCKQNILSSIGFMELLSRCHLIQKQKEKKFSLQPKICNKLS